VTDFTDSHHGSITAVYVRTHVRDGIASSASTRPRPTRPSQLGRTRLCRPCLARPPPHFLSFPHPTRHAPLHPAAEEGRSAGFRPLPRRGALLTLAPREAVGADVGHCPLPDRALCAPQCSNVRRYGCILPSSARYNLKLDRSGDIFFFKSPAEGSPFSRLVPRFSVFMFEPPAHH
jgi:hypothetical protein